MAQWFPSRPLRLGAVLLPLIVILVIGATPAGAAMVDTVPDAQADTADPATPNPPADPAPSTPAGDAAAGTAPDPSVPEDPMTNEAQGEEAPATDITVPPKENAYGQPPFEPAQILWSSVAAADRKLNDATASKRDAIAEVRHLRKRQKQLRRDHERLGTETVDAIAELEAAGERLVGRAVTGYQRFGSGSDSAVPRDPSDYRDVVDAQRRSKMIGSALDVDESDLDRLDQLRSGLSADARSLLDRSTVVADYLAEAEAGMAELDDMIDQSAIEYEAFRAGSEIFIHGVVFPIAGTYPTPLVDSFGFPRMTGTADEHWHEGIDLFADRGTPLVATERGVITKLGVGRLGGLKFWLKGESGSEWYYAHLDSFAPGLANGMVVEAGQLVGYVGNTGNAISTPPHLHMQLHPDGGRPVNPYPLLKVVSDLELAQIAAGTHPGYQYQPFAIDRPPPVQPEEPVEPVEPVEPAPAEAPPSTAAPSP